MAILIPVVAAIAGFIAGFLEGLVVALLYNALAPRIGGVKIRLE